MQTLLIVGAGLIGSSIARAARHFGAADRILMADQSADVISAIERLGIADAASTEAEAFAAEADIVILCTPPATLAAIAAEVLPHMKSGAVLSDVGSIKQSVCDAVAAILPEGISFVPGHPIAGTEYSGPEAGFATLFKDRWCILTPLDETAPAVKTLTDFWQALGSNVALMTPQRHDLVLATTSHVPHLIAYTLVGTAIDMETVTRKEVVKFSAGGFRDFTRIAASDPVMWRDVFLENREGVLEVLGRFIEDLTAMKKAIRWEEGDVLLKHFTKTRDIRRRIIDAGQDEAAPDFGRSHDAD